jgi:PAS domain-containing protein
MSDSHPHCGKSSAPGALAMQASGDGFWELDLADGSAWFSDWFCQRLRRSDPMRRLAFSDLRPLMNSDTWNSLLRRLRAHLEELTPLDTEFPVQLAGGKTEWWHLRGSAQRNDAGHPTHFAGCVRDISADRAAPRMP